MFCYNCKKNKESSAFTKAKACDVCFDKIKAYREANKERYQANRRAKAAIKNEENRKQREEQKRLQDIEKTRVKDEELRIQELARVCPYLELENKGIVSKSCGTCHREKPLKDFRLVTLKQENFATPSRLNVQDRCNL
jgi:CRISPR/Cas system CMR subunit Cmr6 (Cas7 group RAMP superfamily)